MQHRRDLARLDPEAPQLHLIVRTAQELQHPVRPPAHQVPGAVHPAPRSPERIGHEPLRRQPRPAQIATRQTHARDVELARNPRRHRLQARVQHVDLRSCQSGRPIGTVAASTFSTSCQVAKVVVSVGP